MKSLIFILKSNINYQSKNSKKSICNRFNPLIMRCVTLIIVLMIFSFKINAQFGLKKNHILTAYNTIKTTANFPKTWSLSDYEVYSGKRDRKCIDIAIIEINALNGFRVPINASFICYFIRGRMFWHMECEYKPSFVKLFTEESANHMIDLAVNTSLEIERTISKEELCKSSKEEEEERLNQEKRKDEERLEALRKIEADKAKIKEEKARIELEEKTKVAQSEIEGLIRERKYELASQFYSTNNGTYDLNNYYNEILSGLNKTYEKDTVDLSKETVNDFITTNKDNLNALNSGDYEFLFNTEGAFSLDNKTYSISKNIPVKIVGLTDFNSLKVGDKYMGGIIVKITEKEILICTAKPIGSGSYYSALELCSNYQNGGFNWRLPNTEELKTIFSIKNKLDSYEINWYWTSNTNGETAQHLGIQRGDMAYVSKEHGKWIFAVSSICYFKVPLSSKMKISITEIKDSTTKIEYTSSSKKPIFNRNDNQFFYKTKNSLPLCQFEMDPSLPKNVIRSKRFLETIKKANGIILFEEKKTASNDYVISKKE